MMDKKTYLEELSRYFNSVRDKNYKDEVIKSPTKCCGVSCRNCIFKGEGNITCIFSLKNIFDALEILEKWSNEHPQKHKVSKLEYDILDAYTNLFDFGGVKMLNFSLFDRLHEIGYFKGVTKDMYIKDYFSNCEVVEDDG